MSLNFESKIFEKEAINLAGTTEYIIRGGRNLLPLLPKAMQALQ